MNEEFIANKLDGFPDDISGKLGEKVDALLFKFKKIQYLEKNIKEKTEKMLIKGGEGGIYEEILFDFESYLITSRSIIDILMHCINIGLRLGLEGPDVNLGTIYHHQKLDRKIKNILHQYSHNKNIEIWSFIYTNRNKVIHDTSIDNVIPYEVNFISDNTVNFYIYWRDKRYRLEQILYQGTKFLENFTYHLFEIIRIISIEQ